MESEKVQVITAGGVGAKVSAGSGGSSKKKKKTTSKEPQTKELSWNQEKKSGSNDKETAIQRQSSEKSSNSSNKNDGFPTQEPESKVLTAGGASKKSMLPERGTQEDTDFELIPLQEVKMMQKQEISADISTMSVKNHQESMDSMTNHHLLDADAATAGHVHRSRSSELIWLLICFLGIMASFVTYGLLLEYTTSGGRKLHELSFLFVTSCLYTCTAAAGRYVRDETPTTIPPPRFAVLGMTSMASTFCSVRSLRYVIYPIQVLAKSCKPVPVMLMGALMGKKYPLKKYVNVLLIVTGVGLFMGGGDASKKHTSSSSDSTSTSSQLFGILLLFVSLCFDGGTGAYEDKLMSVHSVGPFDLMYNIQLGKTILSGVGLLVFNQVHIFLQMVQEMGILLVALGLSGALGQVFIFVTISKFGALTCSIIGLARKVTTLVASIYFYGHALNQTQFIGLVICISSMVMNFWGKGANSHHTSTATKPVNTANDEECQAMLPQDDSTKNSRSGENGDNIELSSYIKK